MRAMENEEEDGTTPLIEFLDKMCMDALEVKMTVWLDRFILTDGLLLKAVLEWMRRKG